MWDIIINTYFSIAGLCMLVILILILIKAPSNLLLGDTYWEILWWSLFWIICIPITIRELIRTKNYYYKSREGIAIRLFHNLEFFRQTQMWRYIPKGMSLDEYIKLHPEMKGVVEGKSGEEIYDSLTKCGIGKEPRRGS